MTSKPQTRTESRPGPSSRSLGRRLAALAIALAACQATGKDEAPPSGEGPEHPIGGLVAATDTPASIGTLLSELDSSIRAWNNLTLSAQNEADRRRANLLEQNLMFVTHKRRDDLVVELETGPLNNRIVAASALGFTRDAEAQGPLIAALDDPSPNVAANALLGLALLGRADTPLEPVCRHMQSASPTVRNNAALCLSNLVKAGARAECALPSAREGLIDREPPVRAQCALILASLLDTDSLGTIGDLVYDEVPLVGAASARAIAYIGAQVPTAKGEAARLLANAYDKAKGPVRGQALRSLLELSGQHLGTDPEDWKEWAGRLP
jgi:HEAT repeat protein